MPGEMLFPTIEALSALSDGQEADFFALLTLKEELTTRDGKPYLRVAFRDAEREVSFPIWSDSPWSQACRDEWTPGEFYKLRAVYRDTNYGPQLDIRKIRPVCESDRDDGFDAMGFRPHTRFDCDEMFDELISIVRTRIDDPALGKLVLHILETHAARLKTLQAASHNHHAFAGGWLEHVLSVTRTCVYLADKYDDYYPDLNPRLNKSLVVAGGVLHDIGKLRELCETDAGAEYTPSGNLIGHILQGRDIVLEAAAACPLEEDTLLRLEHIIVSHQRLPEWGSPKPPMTPEALLVHYADDMDAKYHMFYAVLRDATGDSSITSRKNALGQKVYRGASPQ